jgi:hypothetical protein
MRNLAALLAFVNADDDVSLAIARQAADMLDDDDALDALDELDTDLHPLELGPALDWSLFFGD